MVCVKINEVINYIIEKQPQLIFEATYLDNLTKEERLKYIIEQSRIINELAVGDIEKL